MNGVPGYQGRHGVGVERRGSVGLLALVKGSILVASSLRLRSGQALRTVLRPYGRAEGF